MKEKKTAFFTRTQLATQENERIGNITIDTAIARNRGILDLHFFSPLTEPGAHLELLESIRSSISTPDLQGQLEEDWDKADKHDDPAAILFQHVKYACLYLELASAAEQNKASDRAWAFNSYASLMIGEIIERAAAIQNLNETDKCSARNSNNAQGRNKSVLPVKEEAARLLEELRPEAGWPYKSTAVAVLERPLGAFIESNEISAIQVSNIEKWLTKWLREDELVNSVWEKTKRPLINNKLKNTH
ncbi:MULTISPECIES: hypothetical protein [Pseudomonas]|uniref:hypothetical protein n=1 Tax=Pseudomonas TaxID=286 RepID=UPI0006939F04|nr:hypothetical protein [Pseudomonas koreensis]AMT87202.1 hypothetical protein AYO71_06500 [Pseudomonas koreensis]MBB4058865.1 hypothetical protein [Pseudomonas koreensis]